MANNRMKLFSTAMLLIVSLVLLVSASVAWFSVSTNPEIGGMQVELNTDIALLASKDDKEYSQAISLSDDFRYYALLKPVSTTDGINWFLPSYDTATGALKDPSSFVLDQTLSHANVRLYDADGNKLSGADYYNAQKNGYYLYTDFWLKTEQENGCKVTLSIPANMGGLATWESAQGLYGTYALANYKKTSDGVARIDNNVQTALRVGFLTQDNGFIIYEPNADQRSVFDQKPKSDDQGYVSGYQLQKDQSNYQSGYYIPTNPIALDSAGKGMLGTVDPAKLIVQKAGAWNLDRLQEALKAGEKPNSNQIASFGQFVKDSGTLSAATDLSSMAGTDLAVASNTMIVTLEQNVPQKIRLFIWLEGQDADCWNDIAAGSFVINLELAAQP